MMRRTFQAIGIWARSLTGARHRAVNEDGTAAVEFAMLAPVMITLFFGVFETSLALICRADVSLMAGTTADLISQANTIQKADVSNVFDAAGTILYPYYNPSNGSDKPTIRLTSVIDDGSGAVGKDHMTGTVAWTCTQSGSGTLPPETAVGGPVTLPQAIMTAGGSVIIAEIAYKYESPTTKLIAQSVTFTNNFYTKPRRVLQIPAPTDGCP
jgi:Flp pilus assembly protein TadG